MISQGLLVLELRGQGPSLTSAHQRAAKRGIYILNGLEIVEKMKTKLSSNSRVYQWSYGVAK